ncbi:MAG TPA: hypothetical protein VJ860_00025 [Polyangia bacterium]|nr:hypothetical protein [Polyangia bacterium]
MAPPPLIHSSLVSPLPAGCDGALAYIEDLGDLTVGNAVRLLRNGAQAFPAWLDAIDAASTRISMEMYIFDDDRIGRRFADALCCAARRGVSVRLLYDFIGCRHDSPEFFANMRRAGVHTVAYHPYPLWRPRPPRPIGLRPAASRLQPTTSSLQSPAYSLSANSAMTGA